MGLKDSNHRSLPAADLYLTFQRVVFTGKNKEACCVTT